MPKKIENSIERGEETETLERSSSGGLGGEEQPDIVAKVEPVRKKRVLSEEQKAKQAENLRKGREALQQKRELKMKETAKMLHDTVVDVKPKAKKEDTKMKKLLEAVHSISNEQEEDPEEEIVVVKKRVPRKKIVVLEEEEEEEHQPLPPLPSAPKQKRKYTKREKVVDTPKAELEPVAPKPAIIFY